jgi:hypothetical protein
LHGGLSRKSTNVKDNTTYLMRIFMDKKDELFITTRTLSNMKNNDYSVGNYKVVKEEADLIISLLEQHKNELTYDLKMKEPIA